MTYVLTIPTVLDAIRNNRRIAAFWNGKGMPGIAQNHIDNIRDLQIVLMGIRFPNNTLPVRIADDFSPVIVVTPDTISDSDRAAFVDAISDSISEADKSAELVSA